jgi:predicted HAD superfamily Cof-like phosphohydrolase
MNRYPVLYPALDDLYEFHHAFEVPVQEAPQWPSEDRIALRKKLLSEEFIELMNGIDKRDLVNTAQELVDLIYVALGTALEFGLPVHHVWEAIHAANMAKLGPDGKPVKRADGKVIKPEGWQKPDIETAIYGAAGRG